MSLNDIVRGDIVSVYRGRKLRPAVGTVVRIGRSSVRVRFGPSGTKPKRYAPSSISAVLIRTNVLVSEGSI
jgi:hypothetical protein